MAVSVMPHMGFCKLAREAFQKKVYNKTTDLFTLNNGQGMVVKITNYGGKIVQLLVPDKDGSMADVVLGYETIEQVIKGHPSYGATIGRYANRIANGSFNLNGQTYQLSINDHLNHLHGGLQGLRFAVMDDCQIDERTLELSYHFKDNEEGYPGNCMLMVSYSLGDNELRLSYHAVTDKTTVVNFTNHSFFNFLGAGCSDILDHELTINADYFTPVNEALIPTGELQSVKGTPMDFLTPHKVGARINADYEQLRLGSGYDHNFVLNKKNTELSFAARVYEPLSGRALEIFTTEPGLQLYSGNFLTAKGRDVGKDGAAYAFRGALCLEPQHFPDSPNQTAFPSTVLNPGEWFSSTTIYRFSVM